MPLPATLPVVLLLETLTEAAFFRIALTKHCATEPSFRKARRYRFDAPDGSFGTLYCARDFKTCFLETLLRDRPGLDVLQADYAARSVLMLLLDTSRLRLVSLHGDAAIILRLDSAELMGMDYDYTQALSKMIYDHPSKPDGIVYRSRFDSEYSAVALFDRAHLHVRLFPNSTPVSLSAARELGDAVRSAVPFILV